MARLTLTPLVTLAALSAAVTAEVAGADLATNTALGAVVSDVADLTTDLGNKADTSALTALVAQVKGAGGYKLSYGPTDQADSEGSTLVANLITAAGMTSAGIAPVAQHSYRINAIMSVIGTAGKNAVATVVVEGAQVVYVEDWDTALSYNVGDMVLYHPAAGSRTLYRCTIATDNTDVDPATDAGTNWEDMGDQSFVGTYGFIEELPGVTRAVVDGGYTSFYAATDTTPSDGVADALPYIDLSGDVRAIHAPLDNALVTLAADCTVVDLGINH